MLVRFSWGAEEGCGISVERGGWAVGRFSLPSSIVGLQRAQVFYYYCEFLPKLPNPLPKLDMDVVLRPNAGPCVYYHFP